MDEKKMTYTEACEMLTKIMDARPDIAKIVFDRENDTFDVVDTNGGTHVCIAEQLRWLKNN